MGQTMARIGPEGLALVLAALLGGCKTGSPSTVAGALTMTGAAIGAAAVSRASGGCIAMCTTGTSCNPNTGLCERLACEGQCEAGYQCAETYSGARCVRGEVEIAAKADGGTPALPVGPVLQAPDSNHTAPTIVPAAEQRPPPK